MNVIFDNIIFSLQKAGGVSVAWYELIKRAVADESINCKFIECENTNIFRQQLHLPDQLMLKNPLAGIPIKIQRYLNFKMADQQSIFHSSYYRTASGPKVNNVTTVYDFIYEYYRSGLSKFIHHRQKGNAIQQSKIIICISHNTKKDLLKFYPTISPERVKVVYIGVDEVYRPIKEPDHQKLLDLIHFSPGEYVLYVGDRRSVYKNFEMAVNACKLADVPLVMIGGSSLTASEKIFLAGSLGENMFTHLGAINNEQLNILYNFALCLLYPSLYEGFGIPVLEAQKAGCPVIASNTSSIPEVAGKGAILLNEISSNEIAFFIKQLKSDSVIVKELRNIGFINSKQFSWDKCYEQTRQLYNSIL